MIIELTNSESGKVRTLETPSHWSITEIERWNEWGGYYFFSPDTKRFFKSRVLSEVFQGPGGIYFVTSEKRGFDDYRRCYSVRNFLPQTGNVVSARNAEGYQLDKFATAAQAKRASKRLANENAP